MRASKQHGFTLIEMIVSLGVFSVVITISVGALLMLVATNSQLQGEQSVMTNLSFALDSMTREIRTGTSYYCDSASNTSSGGSSNIFNDSNDLDAILKSGSVQSTKDCSSGNAGKNYRGLAFIEGGNSITAGSDRILYYFNKLDGKIYRRVGAGASESIVSSGIYIKDFQFFVSGSNPLSKTGGPTEDDQAAVTIYIEAAEVNDPTAKSYYIQTTVTQRTLDL